MKRLRSTIVTLSNQEMYVKVDIESPENISYMFTNDTCPYCMSVTAYLFNAY